MPKPKRTVKIHAPTKPGDEVSIIGSSTICASRLHTFNGLLWADLDELCATEGDTADVGEDVVRDHQTDWDEEPDHALEDIVHYEMGLHNDQVQCHVCPSELRELKLVVALLERADEEDEACDDQLLNSRCGLVINSPIT